MGDDVGRERWREEEEKNEFIIFLLFLPRDYVIINLPGKSEGVEGGEEERREGRRKVE